MARAVAQVKKQKMSVREAALNYRVKRSTLHDIIRGKVAYCAGQGEDHRGETASDVRVGFSHDLLGAEAPHQGLSGWRKTTRFVGDLPGPDIVKGFMKRHPTLIIRTTSMIKRARAVISSKVVEDFFKSFANSAEGSPPRTFTTMPSLG
jgi:hypothetical protein